MIDTLAYLLPALGCAAMMAAMMGMMWMMGRWQRRSDQPSAPSRDKEIEGLRDEVANLRQTRAGSSSTDG